MQAKYNLAHVSTGDLFREAMKADGELGRSVKTYLDTGQLVPDGVTSAAVAGRIERPDCRSGMILDGYPRTLGQVTMLDEILEKRRLNLDAVLYLDVTEQTAIERLGGRLICTECGAGYHDKYMPPKTLEQCDKCGGKLYRRDDDKPETIRERLQVYAAETRALVKEYDRRRLLRRIDANGSPDEVAAAVAAVLDSFASEESP